MCDRFKIRDAGRGCVRWALSLMLCAGMAGIWMARAGAAIPESAWGEARGGLQDAVAFDAEEAQFAMGESIRCQLMVRNVSEQAIRMIYTAPLMGSWRTEVTEGDGQSVLSLPVEFPNGGRVIDKTFAPGEMDSIQSFSIVFRPPGWEGKIEPTVFFAGGGTYKLWHMIESKPGYTPRGDRPWSGTLTSGETEFEIVADGEVGEMAPPIGLARAGDVVAVRKLMADHAYGQLRAMRMEEGDSEAWMARRKAWYARCAQLNPGAIEYLGYVATRYQEPYYRAAACEALGAARSMQAWPLLANALADSSTEVRARAARAFEDPSAHEYAGLLVDAMRSDPEAGVRAAAVYALRSAGDVSILPQVHSVMLGYQNAQVRSALFSLLSVLGDASTLDIVENYLQDPDDEVRFAARSTMAQIAERLGIDAGFDQRPGIAVSAASENVNGLQLRIALEKNIYDFFEPMQLRWSLTNTSGIDLTAYCDSRNLEFLTFEIVEESTGRSIALGPDARVTDLGPWPLKPGDEARGSIDIRRYDLMNDPHLSGRIRVSGRYAPQEFFAADVLPAPSYQNAELAVVQAGPLVIERAAVDAEALFATAVNEDTEYYAREKAALAFLELWPEIPQAQLEQLIASRATAYMKARAEYPRGINASAPAGYYFMGFPGAWTNEGGFRLNTVSHVLLDGMPTREPFEYEGPGAGTGWIRLRDVPEGMHLAQARTEYVLTYRDRTIEGVADSGQVAIEIVGADVPDALAAPKSAELDKQVREALAIGELVRPTIELWDQAEYVQDPYQIHWYEKDGTRVGLSMPKWAVTEALPVDLVFDVEFQIEETGEALSGAAFVVLNGKKQDGYFSLFSLSQFVEGRGEDIAFRIKLTPSRALALTTTEVTQYYNGPEIVSEVQHAKVTRRAASELNGSGDAWRIKQ